METNQQLKNVFTDVRKAYRLLYLYQRRIVDLVQFIGNYWDFKFDKGERYWSNPPKDWSKLYVHHWTWDFLMLYNHTWVFEQKKFKDFENVRLMINIVSDSGFYQKENISELDIKSFEDVNNSETEIYIILKTLKKNWKNRHQDEMRARSSYYKEDDKKGILICQKYSLSDFMNEEETIKCLENFEEIIKDKK